MAARDCGWIQIFAENVQQAFDLVLCAFRIAEDPAVLFPTMVHIDGFHLSHVIEPLYLIEQEDVNGFLPRCKYPYPLNPERPLTMGAFTPPNVYTEAKKAQDVALRSSKGAILNVWEKFGELTGRKYAPVEKYRTGDADVLLLALGSYSETAMMAVDSIRDGGVKVGLIRIRLWRPFPFEELREALAQTETLVVLDRAISFGGPTGPVCSEVQAALYPLENKPKIVSFTGGLGGRDISADSFERIIRLGIEKSREGRLDEMEMIEVRE
jgi:pyruvate ferredoxin oxidoreductase alpha subunit